MCAKTTVGVGVTFINATPIIQSIKGIQAPTLPTKKVDNTIVFI